MTRLKKMSKIARLLKITLISLLLTTNALSAEPVEEQLRRCDLALNAKKQEASLCDLGVKLRDNEIERVSKENSQLREQSGAWYKNPFVWAAIGVIAGAYAGARATR